MQNEGLDHPTGHTHSTKTAPTTPHRIAVAAVGATFALVALCAGALVGSATNQRPASAQNAPTPTCIAVCDMPTGSGGKRPLPVKGSMTLTPENLAALPADQFWTLKHHVDQAAQQRLVDTICTAILTAVQSAGLAEVRTIDVTACSSDDVTVLSADDLVLRRDDGTAMTGTPDSIVDVAHETLDGHTLLLDDLSHDTVLRFDLHERTMQQI